MKNIRFFLSETFPFLVVKFSIYLNRRVFVMSNDFIKGWQRTCSEYAHMHIAVRIYPEGRFAQGAAYILNKIQWHI